jgi:hypothetical protein
MYAFMSVVTSQLKTDTSITKEITRYMWLSEVERSELRDWLLASDFSFGAVCEFGWLYDVRRHLNST